MQANIILIIICVVSISFSLFIYMRSKKKKDLILSYKVIVKFVGGNKTKLVLDEKLYEVFKNWSEQAEGTFVINDDQADKEWKAMSILNKKYVASIEVKKIYKWW